MIWILIIFTGGGHHYSPPFQYPTEEACIAAGKSTGWFRAEDDRWQPGKRVPLYSVAPFSCIGGPAR